MTAWRVRFHSMILPMMLGFELIAAPSARAQGLGGAGTVQGTVKDPTGGVMQAVEVRISNPVSGFARTATTDAAGGILDRALDGAGAAETLSACLRRRDYSESEHHWKNSRKEAQPPLRHKTSS